MSPQPKKAAAAPAETPADASADAPLSIEDKLLDQAADLAEEKAELLKRVDANRKALRNLKDTGLLTADQAAEVDTHYPPITRTAKTEAAGA